MSNPRQPSAAEPPLAVRLALSAGNEALAARFAQLSGERSANQITDLIFAHRHPERRGAPIRRGEPGAERLGREWLDIRDTVVRPAIAAGSTRSSVETSSPRPNLAAGGRPAGPLGMLAVDRPGKPPFRYTFTADDLLWTARFLVGEAGGRDDTGNQAVIWAMFNRYAYFTSRVYPSFHAFLRAYSTPLQPTLRSKAAAARHAHKPDYIKTGGDYPLERSPAGTRIPRGLLRRHRELQQTPWERLPAAARALAQRALSGRQPNPGIGKASEFAETATYYKQKFGSLPGESSWRAYNLALARRKGWTWIGDVPGLVQMRKNTFFIDNRARSWPAVRVLPPGSRP